MKKRTLSFGQNHESWLDLLIEKVRLRSVMPYIQDQVEILDLGCGYGARLLSSLSYKIKRGVGMDLSVNTKLGSKKYKLVKGKIDVKLPFPAASFDIVTALAVIEHVDDPLTMLAEIRRVLRPGGLVLVTTPSKYGKIPLEIMAKLDLISQEEIDDHKRYYSRTSLELALVKVGFKQTHVKPFGIFYLNLLARGRK